MIPLLRKFRERANTGHAYVPLGVNDQHYVTTVSTATNVTHQNTLPAQTTSHGSNPAVLPSVHTSLPPYAPMNITGQNSPYPGQYSTKPPTQHSNRLVTVVMRHSHRQTCWILLLLQLLHHHSNLTLLQSEFWNYGL